MRLTHRITPAASGAPAWVGTEDQWGPIGSASLASSGVGNAIDFAGDNGDFRKVMSAWGGCATVTGGVYIGSTFTPGTYKLFFGGGHTDYFGNELYGFGPLESDTPAYYRLRDATNPPPIDVDTDGSGNPVSRHTYSTLLGIEDGTRRWFFCSGQPFRAEDAGGGNPCHVFDLTVSDPNTNQPWSVKATKPRGFGAAAVYDPDNGVVWAMGSGSVVMYTPSTDTWADGGPFKSPPGGSNPASALDRNRGLWAIMSSTTLNFYRTNNGVSNDYYAPSVTGTPPGNGSGSSNKSIVWDPVDDRFVVWNDNGKQLFFLTPPATNPYQGGNAWTWSSTTPSGGLTPGAGYTDGTFGRFAYIQTSTFRGYALTYSADAVPLFYPRPMP